MDRLSGYEPGKWAFDSLRKYFSYPSSLMDRQRSSKSYKCRFESCLGYYGNVGKRVKLPVCKTGPQGSWVRIPSLPLGYSSVVGRALVWYARGRRFDSGYPNYAVYCGWHTKLFRKQLFLREAWVRFSHTAFTVQNLYLNISPYSAMVTRKALNLLLSVRIRLGLLTTKVVKIYGTIILKAQGNGLENH